MKTPHTHAALIKLWADGYPIQYRAVPHHGEWRDAPEHLIWEWSAEYRIKPEPKPDVVHIWYAEPDSYPRFKDSGPYNLKLTFDGETGKLKSAEVL